MAWWQGYAIVGMFVFGFIIGAPREMNVLGILFSTIFWPLLLAAAVWNGLVTNKRWAWKKEI